MKISISKGKKTENDNLFIIESEGKEIIGIFDIAFYINQLAINELNIIKDKNLSFDCFWFRNVINKSIKDAENGVNWNDRSKDYFNQFYQKPFFIPKKSIDKFFQNGNKRE